jgi:hypothetical protein
MSKLVLNGDTSGSVTLDAPAVSGTTTLTLPTTSGIVVTSANIGIYAPNTMKNRIINGDMVISQRNGTSSVTPAINVATYTVDRFYCVPTQASRLTIQQNAGSVTPPVGFTNYVGITSSSSYTPLTTDIFIFAQGIEGFNTADLAFGTANARTVTLSFWVRSSLTGTFGGNIQNSAETQCYPFNYTINSANTWEQKTITIVGSTTGSWLTNNSAGMYVIWDLGSGSNYKGTVNTWQAGGKYAPTGSTNLISTNGATLYITGVQLEVGSTATSFEWLPYGMELALCQRYYWNMGTGNQKMIGMGAAYTTGSVSSYVQFPVTMRATPTLIQTTGTDYYAFERNGATDGFNSFTGTFRASDTGIQMYSDSGLSGTAGHAGIVWTNNNASSIAFNIEL